MNKNHDSHRENSDRMFQIYENLEFEFQRNSEIIWHFGICGYEVLVYFSELYGVWYRNLSTTGKGTVHVRLDGVIQNVL